TPAPTIIHQKHSLTPYPSLPSSIDPSPVFFASPHIDANNVNAHTKPATQTTMIRPARGARVTHKNHTTHPSSHQPINPRRRKLSVRAAGGHMPSSLLCSRPYIHQSIHPDTHKRPSAPETKRPDAKKGCRRRGD
ncbi:hypothetical protein BKA81DRAFT_418805, partial [Phyllosticta paracitricarpa]